MTDTPSRAEPQPASSRTLYAQSLRKAGMKFREIGLLMGGVSRQRAAQLVNYEEHRARQIRYDAWVRLGHRGHPTEMIKAQALRQKGLTIRQIAGQLGRDRSTIQRWLRRMRNTP